MEFYRGTMYRGWYVINVTENTPRFDSNDYDLIVYETIEDVYVIEKNQTSLEDKHIAYICDKDYTYFRRDTDLFGENTITVYGY